MSNAESELWRAVIRQAIIDATSPLSHRKNERLDQIRAREWFTKPNRDFEETCQMADTEAAHVRKHVLPLIAKADLAPPKQPGRQLKRYEHQGRSLTIAEWAVETGISDSVIRSRLRHGWSIEATLTLPLQWKRNGITPPGVVESISKTACDRTTPVAQETV